MKNVFRIGEWRIEPQADRIVGPNKTIKIEPRVMQVLVYLAEHPGDVATREQILKAVWEEAFVTDEVLTIAISKLRRAFGEEGSDAGFIQTVPKKGYRLNASVLSIPAEASRWKTRRTGLYLGSLAIGLVLIAGGLWKWLDRQSGGDTGAVAPKSIAVLPFKSISPGDRDIFLELGLADALITKLSNVSRITVRPTSAVRNYTETQDSSIDVARKLRVDTVLEGTVQRDDDWIRVTVQLLRVDDGKPMWADTFDEDFTSIFVLQDTIAERVASALVSTLTREDRAGLSKSHTDDIEALQLYWRGRLFMDQRDEQSLRKSIEFFEKAVQADPSYALAYAGLAQAYGFILFHGYDRPADVLIDLKAAVTKALELDDTLAEAQTLLASLKVLELDWEGSERARQRAIELSPNYGTAHLLYAFFLTGMERHEESLEHRRKALMSDPNNPVMRAAMARGYLGVGQLDRAEKQARQAIEFAPDHGFAYWHLGDLYLVQDRFDEAIQAFERSGFRWRLGYAYGVAGRRKEALAILAELEERSERGDYVSPFHRAAIYSGLGDKDKAFEWLEQVYLERTPWLVWYRVDHTLDPLRSDPRYVDLGRRLGLLE